MEKVRQGADGGCKAVLCLGGNVAPREEYLRQAIELMKQHVGRLVQLSSVYETASWGFCSDNFLNQIALFETVLSPAELLRITQKIETDLGRREKTGKDGLYHDRTIDIDILFMDGLVINSDALIIPHQKMTARRFVMEGLLETMPDFVHPVLHKKIRTLYNECTDSLKVVKLGDVSQ